MDAPRPPHPAPPAAFSFQTGYEHPDQQESDADKAAAAKNLKRKRLAKSNKTACDACHRSKRRCDGKSPCSNCYFASKSCHYTDSSGRPVAAPNIGKPDASKAHGATSRSTSSRSKTQSEDDRPRSTKSSQDRTEGDRRHSRSRVKTAERAQNQETSSDPGPSPDSIPEDRVPLVLDHALTRELTNLFFTHCHPVRAIIHKPSFSAALSHNRVPSYLLYAICALAAPLSRQPRVRTSPSYLAARVFAKEAMSLMFDGSGNLNCDASLPTAQALCILMVYNLVGDGAPVNMGHRDLALQIVQTLGVHDPEHPVITPVPTPDVIHAALDQECRPVSLNDSQLRLRLPVDETSFELVVHSTLPEYLYLPPVRTPWVSELGHLIRIMSIYTEAEQTLSRPDSTLSIVMELEKRGEEWSSSLPEHLRFSEQNLQVQQSMFETSSNTGAWCFCGMHIYYVSLVLALYVGRRSMLSYSTNTFTPERPQWTLTRLDMIMAMLGERAKNSMLMGAVLWTQLKYCNRDDSQIRGWLTDYEDLWGVRLQALVAAAMASRFEWGSQTHSQPNNRVQPQSYPLGRSLDELRLHGHAKTWPNTTSHTSQLGIGSRPILIGGEKDSRRGNDEVDMDYASKNTGGGRLGESLPSLKSSGLLDSWNSNSALLGGHSRADMRGLSLKSSPPSQGMESDVRTALSLPVGLKWLANESR